MENISNPSTQAYIYTSCPHKGIHSKIESMLFVPIEDTRNTQKPGSTTNIFKNQTDVCQAINLSLS